MIPACQIMQDIIIYESEKNFDYKTFGVSTKLMRDKAYKLISNKKLKRSSGGRFEYVRDDSTFELISTSGNICCSCVKYFDKAICHHLIAACEIDEVYLPGVLKKV